MQRTEALEIAVVRQYSFDAVFPAHGRDLCVEHQVAVRIRLSSGGKQPLQELRSGLDNLAAW